MARNMFYKTMSFDMFVKMFGCEHFLAIGARINLDFFDFTLLYFTLLYFRSFGFGFVDTCNVFLG